VWLVRPSVAVLLPGSASGALCSECCLMLYPFFLEISVCLYLCSLAAAFWLCLAVFLLILWISEGALGRFSVRFCGLFVLLCLAVLLVAGASGALLSECC
jgi:hypothetical protein